MGRGNCNVRTEIGESLYYISNDYLHMYVEKANPEHIEYNKDIPYDKQDEYEFDQESTQINFDETIQSLADQFMKRFKSMTPCDIWVSRHKHAILENKCFYIALEDNEWSIAVELLIKEDANINLQRKNAANFGKGIRDILLKNFDTIHIRTSAWTSSELTKEDVKTMDEAEKETKRQLETNKNQNDQPDEKTDNKTETQTDGE